MKRFKMTTCLVLAILIVCMSTVAFAGTKYSNAVGFGKVLVRPTATPAPTEEPNDYYFERDASGNLVLDSDGDPVVYVPDGFRTPTGFERDANGNLVLDGSGDPILLFGEVTPVTTPAPEATEEPVVETTEEPAVEATEEPVVETTEEPAVEATEEPVVEATEEPVVETTEEPAVEATEEPAVEATEEPVVEATEEPVVEATEEPVVETTEEPAVEATEEPVVEATEGPAVEATEEPMPTVPTEEPIEVVEDGYSVNEEGKVIYTENGVAQEVQISTYYVKADGLALNYRVSPEGEIVNQIEDGSEIAVVNVGEEWTLVLIDGSLYYVQTQFITEEAPVEDEDAEDEEAYLESIKAAVESVKITIETENEILIYGDKIWLNAQIPEILADVRIQWQEKLPGGEWANIPDANTDSLTVVLNAENAAASWRVLFTVG